MTIEESRERLKQAEKEIRASQDKQSFTLEEIEAAMRRDLENHRGQGRGFQTAFQDLKAELTRPAHSFREGEVFYNGDALGYAKLSQSLGMMESARPLTLSEMPKAVEDLREWVRNGTTTSIQALAAFDSEISHE